MRLILIGCIVGLISAPALAQQQGKKQGSKGGQMTYEQCFANMTRMGLKGGEASQRCRKLSSGNSAPRR